MAANNESMRKILATELSEKQQKDYDLILDSLSFQSQREIHYIRLYKLLAYGRIDDFEHHAKVMFSKEHFAIICKIKSICSEGDLEGLKKMFAVELKEYGSNLQVSRVADAAFYFSILYEQAEMMEWLAGNITLPVERKNSSSKDDILKALRNELEYIYREQRGFSAVLDDLMEIAALFMNEEKLTEYLITLDTELARLFKDDELEKLQQQSKDQGTIARNDRVWPIPPDDFKSTKQVHKHSRLETVLAEPFIQAGFSIKKIPKFLGSVSHDQAKKVINKIGTFKESPYDISINHGKHMHMLQAWLIMKHLGPRRGKELLSAMVNINYLKENPLWRYFLDRGFPSNPSIRAFTFSEPYGMHSYLMTSKNAQKKFPVLSAYLRDVFFSSIITFMKLENEKAGRTIASPTITVLKHAVAGETEFNLPLITAYVKPEDVLNYWKKQEEEKSHKFFGIFSKKEKVKHNDGVVYKPANPR